MRTLVFVAATGLLLSPCFGKPLGTAEEIQRIVSGNTISGVENGQAYQEYYERDGFIRGREANGLYTGEWQVSGRQICIRYYNDDAIPEDSEDDKGVPGAWECTGLELEGSNLFWVSEGERSPARLSAGNPNGL